MARFRMQVCFFFFSFLFYSLSEGLNSLHLFPSSRILYVSWIYLFSNIYNLLLFYQLIKFVNLKIDGFCVGLFCFALLYFTFCSEYCGQMKYAIIYIYIYEPLAACTFMWNAYSAALCWVLLSGWFWIQHNFRVNI